MSFLLDTNAVSEWTKPRPDRGLIAWFESADEDRTFLSVVTIAELKFGIERLAAGRRRSNLEQWLHEELMTRFEGRLLSIDARVAEAWGDIAARCAALGRPIGIMDCFIAATATAFELTLVTRNASHFQDAVASMLNPWSDG